MADAQAGPRAKGWAPDADLSRDPSYGAQAQFCSHICCPNCHSCNICSVARSVAILRLPEVQSSTLLHSWFLTSLWPSHRQFCVAISSSLLVQRGQVIQSFCNINNGIKQCAQWQWQSVNSVNTVLVSEGTCRTWDQNQVVQCCVSQPRLQCL